MISYKIDPLDLKKFDFAVTPIFMQPYLRTANLP
jgi:hypothetical protein